MGLLERLGLSRSDPAPRSPLRAALEKELGHLPPARAEFVAAFAGLLVRVAYADRDVSDAERKSLRTLVAAITGLSADEARAVAEVVVREAAFAGIEYAHLTRAFNEVATTADKECLIDCLFALATADDTVSLVEDEEIRAVSRALLLSHGQFVAVRSRYKEKLEVIQALRRQRGG